MKNTILLTVLLLVIGLAVGRLIWYYGSQPEPGEPIAHRMPVACEKCGKNYDGTLGKQPGKCRLCGQIGAWRGVKCSNAKCGTIYAMVGGGQSVEAPALKCPKCGGESYTTEMRPDELGKP